MAQQATLPPPTARKMAPALNTLKVLSYNILADKYASYNSYCPPQFLKFSYREPLILQELQHHAADIVCLQEVDQFFYEGSLQPWMAARGMEGHFLARLGEQGDPRPLEGVALFWRSELLEALQQRELVYAQAQPDSVGCPQSASDSDAWKLLVGQREGAILVLLRHRASALPLLAAVTHLFWNPAYPDVKTLQAGILCSAMRGMLDQNGLPPDTALVLGGDFNSLAVKHLPDKFDPEIPSGSLMSGVYTLLSTGSLEPTHPDHPAARRGQGAGSSSFPQLPLTSAGLRLESLNVVANGTEPPVTNRTAWFAGCLDYFWLGGVVAGPRQPPEPIREQQQQQPAGAGARCTSSGLAVASALPMPYPLPGEWRDPLADVACPAIPDAFYPSDHLAVGGEVVLLPL